MKKKKNTKLVRVDAKTVIEVDKNKDNEKAIKDFLKRTQRHRPKYLYKDGQRI